MRRECHGGGGLYFIANTGKRISVLVKNLHPFLYLTAAAAA